MKQRVNIVVTQIVFRNNETEELEPITCQSTVQWDKEISSWDEVKIAVGRNQLHAVCEETGRDIEDAVCITVSRVGRKVIKGYINYIAGTN